MKTQNIIKGILVLLMLSGCATNKKEEITPTPNITVTPTLKTTPQPTDISEENLIDIFNIDDFEIENIMPLLK